MKNNNIAALVSNQWCGVWVTIVRSRTTIAIMRGVHHIGGD